MEDYLSVLPEESMKTVKTSNNTNSVYHFDDRKESKAIQNVGIPVATGDNQYTQFPPGLELRFSEETPLFLK